MVYKITKENPSFPYNQQRIKIFRDGFINWQHLNNKKNIVNQSKVEQISNYSRNRLEKLAKAIETGKQFVKESAEGASKSKKKKDLDDLGRDSDEDCYGYSFNEGDQVDVL